MSATAQTAALKLLYRISEAAVLLSISERSLWELIKRREVKSRRIGRRVYVHRDELLRFARKSA